MKVSDVPQLAEFSISEDTMICLFAPSKHGVFQKRLNRSINLESHSIKLLLGQLKSTEEELQKLICSE